MTAQGLENTNALPIELLSLIFASVPFGFDKLNFGGVCTRWREALASKTSWSLRTSQHDKLWTRDKFSLPAAQAMTNLLLIECGMVLKDALSAGGFWMNICRLEVHCHSPEGVAQVEGLVLNMPQLQLLRLGVCSSNALVRANLRFVREDCQLHLFVAVHEGGDAVVPYKDSINKVLTKLEVHIHPRAHNDISFKFGNLTACKALRELDIKSVRECAFQDRQLPALLSCITYQGPHDKLIDYVQEHTSLYWVPVQFTKLKDGQDVTRAIRVHTLCNT